MRLLIVEDDDRVAAALGSVLRRHGFDVCRARTAKQALELLDPRTDLVLLDLGLPDHDGFEVCERIRRVSAVPVIVVTARSDLSARVHGLNLGADDYIVKPYDLRELIARIHAVTRRGQRDPLLALAPGAGSGAAVATARAGSGAAVGAGSGAPSGTVAGGRRPSDAGAGRTDAGAGRMDADGAGGGGGAAAAAGAAGTGTAAAGTAGTGTAAAGTAGTGTAAAGTAAAGAAGTGAAGTGTAAAGTAGTGMGMAGSGTASVGAAGGRDLVEAHGVRIDLAARRVTVDGRQVLLTRKEFDLLAQLARAPGVVFRKEQIVSQVWGTNWRGMSRTLEVHVGSLRHKLGVPRLVETVRGVGYRLVPAPDEP